jgi:hypothetical protein
VIDIDHVLSVLMQVMFIGMGSGAAVLLWKFFFWGC